MPTRHQTENQDVTLSYLRTGDGSQPLVVLCHGFTDNGSCWERTTQVLQSDYDVVTPDARNHGLSGNGPAGIDDLASDIAAIIDACGSDKVFVLGHSVGAASAAAFAARYPDKIRALVLEDPAWIEESISNDPKQTEARAKGFEKYITHLAGLSLEQITTEGQKTHPKWHEQDFPAWAESKQQVRADAMARLDLGDWQEYVGSIECPTLLVHGDQDNGCDGMISASFAAKLAAINANITVCHVPNAGHNLRREQFAPYAEYVTSFLSSL